MNGAQLQMEAALMRAGGSIPSREAGEGFFKLLFAILKNIATKPDEPKYRSIKLTNKVPRAGLRSRRSSPLPLHCLGLGASASGSHTLPPPPPPPQGFASKVGAFDGGLAAMEALGFKEVEGELQLQLVWGRPDGAVLQVNTGARFPRVRLLYASVC